MDDIVTFKNGSARQIPHVLIIIVLLGETRDVLNSKEILYLLILETVSELYQTSENGQELQNSKGNIWLETSEESTWVREISKAS